jgi:PrkA AAA domain
MAEYLESCRSDPKRYANAAERLLAAIGEPQMIDTAKDPRLGRIFFEPDDAHLPSVRRLLWHGCENGAMVEPVRHRRTKGRQQICSNLKLPRHTSQTSCSLGIKLLLVRSPPHGLEQTSKRSRTNDPVVGRSG